MPLQDCRWAFAGHESRRLRELFSSGGELYGAPTHRQLLFPVPHALSANKSQNAENTLRHNGSNSCLLTKRSSARNPFAEPNSVYPKMKSRVVDCDRHSVLGRRLRYIPNNSRYLLTSSAFWLTAGVAATCWKWPILRERGPLKACREYPSTNRVDLSQGPFAISPFASHSLCRRLRIWLTQPSPARASVQRR